MCEYLGYHVTELKRVRIMDIKLDLKIGKYRDITNEELKKLNQLIQPSSKTI